jgi:hypothetical protein
MKVLMRFRDKSHPIHERLLSVNRKILLGEVFFFAIEYDTLPVARPCTGSRLTLSSGPSIHTCWPRLSTLGLRRSRRGTQSYPVRATHLQIRSDAAYCLRRRP